MKHFIWIRASVNRVFIVPGIWRCSCFSVLCLLWIWHLGKLDFEAFQNEVETTKKKRDSYVNHKSKECLEIGKFLGHKLWHHDEVVITIAQLQLTKPELRFCTGSNLAHGVLKACNGESLWQWSRLEIMALEITPMASFWCLYC